MNPINFVSWLLSVAAIAAIIGGFYGYRIGREDAELERMSKEIDGWMKNRIAGKMGPLPPEV